MAPTKRPRENATRNRDKTRRRKRAQEVRPLFKFMGQLCGEECEQDLTPVSESAGRGSARRDNGSRRREMLDDAEMDGIAEELSDEEYDEPRNPAPARSGRLAKAKLRKSGQGGQASEMPLKIGVQKAMRYICEALAFGLQSGYLTPRDSKGKLLRVSSELFQTPEPARGRRGGRRARAAALEEAAQQVRQQAQAALRQEPQQEPQQAQARQEALGPQPLREAGGGAPRQADQARAGARAGRDGRERQGVVGRAQRGRQRGRQERQVDPQLRQPEQQRGEEARRRGRRIRRGRGRGRGREREE